MFSSLRALLSRAAVSTALAVTVPAAPATAQETNVWTTATVAGGDVNDGGPAASGQLYSPRGVALDASGNLYIADTHNHRIRKVDASTGNISTVAGDGTRGYSGDGGPATAAQLNYPYSVALDGAGNLYIALGDNHRIRKVDASTGNISTIAGTGTRGYSGVAGHEQWKAARFGQQEVPRAALVETLKRLLAEGG